MPQWIDVNAVDRWVDLNGSPVVPSSTGCTLTTGRDPLEDASTELSRAIAEIHDLLREAKTAKDQSRQGAIYARVVTLKGFLDALVIDARRDLDALKDIPL